MRFSKNPRSTIEVVSCRWQIGTAFFLKLTKTRRVSCSAIETKKTKQGEILHLARSDSRLLLEDEPEAEQLAPQLDEEQ